MPDRRGWESRGRRYPRTARVNEVLREIVAEALETVADDDERLELATVTGVVCDADLRSATVYYSTSHQGADEALMEHRVYLQGEIAAQTRFKRTPRLSFVADPGVSRGWRIEEALGKLGPGGPGHQGPSPGELGDEAEN